jgi:hypothetical protein
MPEPTNKALYNKVKAEAKRKFKVWPSAYGSQWLVKTYKERGGTYGGSPKKSSTTGVTRWNKEKWKDEKGNVCGSKKNKNTKKCRPTVRVTKKTPVTWGEMTKSQKQAAVREKKNVGMGRKTKKISNKNAKKSVKSPTKKKSVKSPTKKKSVKSKKKSVKSPSRRRR